MDRTEEAREMRHAQQYLEIVRSRGERDLDLKRVYRQLQKRELFLMAYAKLYSNDGALTPGIDPTDTVDAMSLKRIDKIIAALQTGTYQWKPARRTYIPKKNGQTRPLGVVSWSDKLLQEVLRMILSAYYEPQFSSNSHGFRPGRGCHTALQDILHHWKGTKWFIEGDLEKWVVFQMTAGRSEQTSVAGISQKRPPQKPYLADQAENWSIFGRVEGRFDPLTPTIASWGRRKET